MSLASNPATEGRPGIHIDLAGRGDTVQNLRLAENIAVKNLEFFYGDHRALKNSNVSLYAKTVTAFIGPSGCGKSTLLRTLNRIYDLYPNQRVTGEIVLDGENILSPRQDLNLLRARV